MRGLKRVALFAAVLLACAAPVAAETPILLTQDQYAPLKNLPPPPAPGSPKVRAEIAEIERMQAAATPAQLAAAAWDDAHEDGSIFADAIGPAAWANKLPATAEMIHVIVKNEGRASSAAKHVFRRDRPWIVDPSIKTCTPHWPGPAANSYPSGHSSVGFAIAVVLASLMPGKAKAILARAQNFAENRILCGYHFRSDIVAGKMFGILIGNDLMKAPGFRPYYRAAQAELHAVHLAP